jgi:hypothetical protein
MDRILPDFLLVLGLVTSIISINPPWNVRWWFGGIALACAFLFLCLTQWR